MISQTISHYRILSRLGEGGMGEVFLAEDTTLGRKVAIKFLRPESLGNENAKKRLIREARAAATLDHPNICAVYEVGEEDSVSFIVMQYVEGETLDRAIRRGPIEDRLVLDLAGQIADALSEAHSHNIIHRDIKPPNIMITARGHARLMDFGLAKFTDASLSSGPSENESVLTTPGRIIGTLPYMSPEQVKGEELDARSDIFTFGAVLYEMLTGRRAFDLPTKAELISAILTSDPVPIAQLAPARPAGFQQVVSRAMAKARGARYQTASDLLLELREVAAGRIAAGPVAGQSSWSATATQPIPAPETGSQQQPRDASVAVSSRRRRSGKPIESLAVLPLANASDDPGAEYLSDGITASIINSLSQAQGLRVMAKSTVFRYKGRDVDPQSVGRELRVRAVLNGRVMQVGDSLIVRTELVDTEDGAQLWGEQYNRKHSDIIAVQEEIASAIVEKLRLKLSGAERKKLTKRHTVNPEAYQLYLKGLYQVARGSVEANVKAIEYFNQALEADPSYALAFTGMADAYIWLAHMFVHPRETFPKARAAVIKAIELDDKIAEAHSILALVRMYFEYDWSGAEAEFARALDLNPNDPAMLRQYGFYLSLIGKSDQAIAALKRAQDIDPLSVVLGAVLGWAYYFARRADDAVVQFRKTLELAPGFYNAAWGLGQAHLQQDQLDEAIVQFKKATEMSAGHMPETTSSLALAYGLRGQRDEARALIGGLKDLSHRRHVSPYYMALTYLGLGELDRVFECLEQAYEDRFGWMTSLNQASVWDSVRSDPRFVDLVQRINFPS